MTQLKLECEEALPSTVSNSTAQYSILVTCNKCAGVHETGFPLRWKKALLRSTSIGSFYSGKSLPKTLVALSNQEFLAR